MTEFKEISDYSNGTFRPSMNLTRVQAIVMNTHFIGMPKLVINIKDQGFNDERHSSFSYKEIAVVSSDGIINGKRISIQPRKSYVLKRLE